MSFTRSSLIEVFTKKAKDFVSLDFLACDASSSIKECIDKIQKEKKSTILILKEKKLIGIITEQDIVRKIIFKSKPDDPIGNYMTSPVEFVYDYDLLFHAIGTMRKNNLRHLPVINMTGDVLGIIYMHKALEAELGDSIKEIDDLTFEKNEDGIVKLKKKQIELAENLLSNKVNAFDVSYLLSFINIIIYRRAIRLAQKKVNEKKIIQNIPDFCVLVMGSGGRMESYLHPDQDNGIIYDLENSSSNKEQVDKYFYELAKEFTRILDMADIPYCKGDLMATNPLWRKSLEDWKLQLDNWIQSSNDNSLRYLDMLYDFQPVFGNENLAKSLRYFLLKKLEKTPQFLKYLYKRDEGTNAAIGMFGQFILEKEDNENLNLLNLKHTGTLPLVESIRMYSIKHQVDKGSTIDRLQELTEKKVFTTEEFDFLKNALEYLSSILMSAQIRQVKKNLPIKNYIDPKGLYKREKKLLKMYLKEIKSLKTRLKGDFGEEYV